MSSITKCLNTSTICRKVARCDKKLCVVLIEADIFNKAVQGNIPKPLRNLYIKFDVDTLRHCGEMACVEEHLHTFGNSDITNCSCDHSDEFQTPLHPAAWFAHTGRTLVRSVLRLQYESRILQATNTAKPWQRDFELVRFLVGYSFFYCCAGLICLKNEARAKLQRESIQ